MLYTEGILIVLSVIMIFLLAIAGFMLYFLPSIIAFKRDNVNKGVILLINILLGWTFLGWVGILVWALVDTDGSGTEQVLGNFKGNKYDNLEKLQKLRQSGAITEAEFEIEKSKILK